MLERLVGRSSAAGFIRLSGGRRIEPNRISRERLPGGSSIIFKTPDKYEPQRDQHHRQPEPEKDFEKDAPHRLALIPFERVDVSDSANRLNAILAVRSRPELLAQVADVHVEAAIESREFAAKHLLGEFFALDDAAG